MFLFIRTYHLFIIIILSIHLLCHLHYRYSYLSLLYPSIPLSKSIFLSIPTLSIYPFIFHNLFPIYPYPSSYHHLHIYSFIMLFLLSIFLFIPPLSIYPFIYPLPPPFPRFIKRVQTTHNLHTNVKKTKQNKKKYGGGTIKIYIDNIASMFASARGLTAREMAHNHSLSLSLFLFLIPSL